MHSNPLSRRLRRLALAAIAIAGVVALPSNAGSAPATTAATTRPAWRDVRSFAIQNSGFGADGLAPVAAADKDMVIVGRLNAAHQPWTKAEVDAAGHDKWVLSYMSVAEAQRSEWYWQPEWNTNPPSWVIGQNPWWYNNVYTETSDLRWKILIGEHLNRLIAQGFDGAFLDVVDAYWFPNYPGGPSMENMRQSASLVCEIAYWVHLFDPEFKLVVNNSVNLVADIPGYNTCMDGTMIEGLWWFSDVIPRDEAYRTQKIGELRAHQALGKPIFALDYAPAADRPRIAAEAASLGYMPYFTDFGIVTAIK